MNGAVSTEAQNDAHVHHSCYPDHDREQELRGASEIIRNETESTVSLPNLMRFVQNQLPHESLHLRLLDRGESQNLLWDPPTLISRTCNASSQRRTANDDGKSTIDWKLS